MWGRGWGSHGSLHRPGKKQHLRETSPVAQGTCSPFQTRGPPADTQTGGLPGEGALGLWGLARETAWGDDQRVAGHLHLSFAQVSSLHLSQRPRTTPGAHAGRDAAPGPASVWFWGLMLHHLGNKTSVIYPLKNLRRQQDGWGLGRTVTRVLSPGGSTVSQQSSDRHARTPAEPPSLGSWA